MPKKLTHEDYLQKLQEKQIKVIPLELYISSHTNIKHICSCGHIFNSKPLNILKNRLCKKCGIAKRTITHEEYIIKLKEKNIKVYPLEKIKATHRKLLHKCICGNEWECQPRHVLNGITCKKCMKFNIIDIETYRNNPTILYYIKVDNLFKIGLRLIKNNYKDYESEILKGRYGDKKYKNYNIEILQYKVYEDGAEAYLMEQQILDMYDDKKYMYVSENMNNFGGYTELFTEDIKIKL